jgi:hypothetical protein
VIRRDSAGRDGQPARGQRAELRELMCAVALS